MSCPKWTIQDKLMKITRNSRREGLSRENSDACFISKLDNGIINSKHEKDTIQLLIR